MNLKHLIGGALLTTITSFSSLAQQAKVEGIKPHEFQGVHEIQNVGFYTVYEEDNQKGKIRNYTLRFYDFDYQETSSAQIELSKVATVSSSANNTTHLAIAFSDSKLNMVKVKSFDLTGKLSGELDLPESAFPLADIYKAPNGFVIVNQIRKSAMSATVQFNIIGVDNELNILWEKELNDEKIREVIDIVATEDGVAAVYTSGKGMGKENYDQHMMRLSNSGDVIFDQVFASNYYYFPNKILVDGENTLIFGSYPEQGKSKPVGVFAISFNQKGEIVAKKEMDYKTNISPEIKDIKTESDINMKDEPQFIVNDAIKTPDGYVVITETIALRPSVGGGVNISTATGTSTTVQVNTAFIMGDFMILNLNPTFELDEVKVVTKPTNKVVFQGTIFNVNQYHAILEQNNVSNYRFCVKGEDQLPLMVYTIRKSYLSNITVGVANISKPEKVVTSELIESDLTKLKDVNGFGVLKNINKTISVYVFAKGILSFYDLKY